MRTKQQTHLLYLVLFLFVTAELFGLWVTQFYSSNEFPFGIQRLNDQGIFSLSSFLLTLFVMTGFILIIVKFKIMLWKLVYGIGIVLAMSVTLNIFFGWIAILVALIITLLKLRTQDAYLHNLTEILTYGGVVAVIVSMFNPVTAVLLLALISLYDIYSVYISKHMIRLAKVQTKAGVFPGISVHGKDSASFLGGGDVAFPMLFAGVFVNTLPVTSLFIITGAAIGLLSLLMSGEKGAYYPAMPFLSAGAMIGMMVSVAFA